MAEKKKAETSNEFQTTYVVDSAPDLPDASVVPTRPEPLIDQRLVEARDAEAAEMADRFK